MTARLLLLLLVITMGSLLFDLELSLGPGLSVKNACLYLIVLSIAIEGAVRRNIEFKLWQVFLPFILLISYATLSWFMVAFIIDRPGYSSLRSFIGLKSQLYDQFLILAAFFYGLRSSDDAIWLGKRVLVMVILTNVITFIDVMNLPDLGLITIREDGRVNGPVGESNQYGAYLAFFLPAIAGMMFATKGRQRLFFFFGAIISFLALITTVSRGAFVALSVGGLAGYMIFRRFIPGRTVALAVVGMGALLILGIVAAYLAGFGDLIWDRVVVQSSGGGQEVSSGRGVIWMQSLLRMADEPVSLLTGFGWDTYRILMKHGFAPHNTYLGYFFELGFMGLALLFAVILAVVLVTRAAIGWSVEPVRSQLIGFTFGLLSLAVAIIFVELHAAWLFIWAYVGVILRLVVSAGQETGSPDAVDVRSEHEQIDYPRAPAILGQGPK